MTDVKRRIKTIEKRIGLDKRERVVLIRPSKFADETRLGKYFPNLIHDSTVQVCR